jgi:hypothetical protein
MARLDFWCELASPYTYLAAMRIDDRGLPPGGSAEGGAV